MRDRQAREDGTWPPVPTAGVTELRVHGVGGTPPEDMLDGPEPVQVSGDGTAGVWRSSTSDGSPNHRVEAYAWGGLTARPLVSALWLLVLPLSLVNVAGWMCPSRDTRGSGLFRGLVRLAGVAVTTLYVAFAAVLGMDFAAYQCAGAGDRDAPCAATSWWLVGEGGALHDPALRVLAGAVLPLVLLAVLGGLARRSRLAYESYGVNGRGEADHPVDNPAERGLEYPGFWRGEAYADRLAELHLAVGTLVVAYVVARSTDDLTGSAPAAWLSVVIGLALALVLTLASVSRLRRRLPRGWVLGLSALAMAAATVLTVAAPPAQPDPPAVLVAVTEIFNPLVGLLLILVLALLVTGLVVARSCSRLRGRRAAELLRHAATPASVVVVAFLLTLTFLSGVVLTAAFWLGEARAYRRGEDDLPAIEYAQAFEVLARAVPVFLALLAAAALAGWLVAGRRERAETARRERAWAAVSQPDGWRDARKSGGRWLAGVRRAHRFPEQTLAAIEWGVWAMAGVATSASLVWMVVWWFAAREQGTPHLDVDLGWYDQIPLAPCLLLLTSIVAGAVYAIRRTLSSPSTRRVVAIAWDVATFWPRSFQPLAPPSYAERAVPELTARLDRLWDEDRQCPGSVLLLGHSQGSVLVAAVAATLPPGRRGRLEVVTYGSPLRRLYGRHFPAYFGTGFLRGAVERVGRTADGTPGWRNAYKDTDYIGGRLFGEDSAGDGDVDVYLADPPHPFMPPGDPAPPVRRHSEPGYRRQLAFEELRQAATARLSARG